MSETFGVYLAGPEVFLPNAKEILAEKCSIARAAGFRPVAPGDAEIPTLASKYERGMAISAYDEQLMQSADAIIANLTPFRGVSADPGTCYELGFMCALGRPACGYTNDARSYFERVSREHGSEDGMHVEDFDMIDNLMMHGGIAARTNIIERHQALADEKFTDMTAFRKVVARLARQVLTNTA